jgi:hypothetical protein
VLHDSSGRVAKEGLQPCIPVEIAAAPFVQRVRSMRSLLILVLTLSSACSFLLVRRPSPEHPSDCQAPVAAPVLDVGGFVLSAGVTGLAGLYAGGQHSDAGRVVIGGGLASIAFLVSSVYGFMSLGSCPTMAAIAAD